jgi:hypothetical protein
MALRPSSPFKLKPPETWKLEQRVQERYSFSRLEELLAKKETATLFSCDLKYIQEFLRVQRDHSFTKSYGNVPWSPKSPAHLLRQA